jgi:hypothetical protein
MTDSRQKLGADDDDFYLFLQKQQPLHEELRGQTTGCESSIMTGVYERWCSSTWHSGRSRCQGSLINPNALRTTETQTDARERTRKPTKTKDVQTQPQALDNPSIFFLQNSPNYSD